VAYVLQEDPIPVIDSYISFRVDDNTWAVPGQVVSVVAPDNTLLGYFTVFSITVTVDPNFSYFYVTCVNSSIFSAYNQAPLTQVPINSIIGPTTPPTPAAAGQATNVAGRALRGGMWLGRG